MAKKTKSTSAVTPASEDGDVTCIELDVGDVGTVQFQRGDAMIGVGTSISMRGELSIQVRRVPGELPEEIKAQLSHMVNLEAGKLLQKVKKTLIDSKQLALMVTDSRQGDLFPKPTPAPSE